jgi:hypothetical protein
MTATSFYNLTNSSFTAISPLQAVKATNNLQMIRSVDQVGKCITTGKETCFLNMENGIKPKDFIRKTFSYRPTDETYLFKLTEEIVTSMCCATP